MSIHKLKFSLLKRISSIVFLLLLAMPSGSIAAPEQENITSILPLLLGNRAVATSTVNDDVITIDGEDVASILKVITNETYDTQLQLSGDLADSVQDGSLLFVLAGADDRFPLGMSGRVVETTNNADGTKTVKLEKVSYADIFQGSTYDLEDITLDASNFVGVIAPSGVQAASQNAFATQSVSGEEFYSFRNGAIVIGTSGRKIARQSYVTQDGTIEAPTVSLNMKVDLGDMGDGVEASTMRPVDDERSVGFVITGKLDNITLTNKHDISLPKVKLNSLDLRMDGDLNFDIKFNGRGEVQFGYFSQAWKEVESETFSILGVSGNVTGLSSDDKIGKYPLAGLVWSIPCPNTCPVISGKTQTPLRQAKVGGIIVWLYLTIEGEFSLEGDLILARLSPADLSLGIKKPVGDDFQLVRSLERKSSTGRLLEAPSVDGSFGVEMMGGLTNDFDFFVGGLRIANVGMDIGARLQAELNGSGSFGADSLSSPWGFDGNACLTGDIGGGAVVRSSVGIGVEIDTGWKDVSGELKYETQIPTDEEMSIPGKHGAWHTWLGWDICWPSTPIQPTLSMPLDTSVLNASAVNLFSWTDDSNPTGTRYCLVINYLDGSSAYNTCDGIGTTIDWFEALEYSLPADSLNTETEYTWTVFAINAHNDFSSAPVWWNFSTASESPICTDSDGDGYYSEAGCGTEIDCNDNDPEMSPGLDEICDDGKDNNCNGQVDEGCAVLPLAVTVTADSDPLEIVDPVTYTATAVGGSGSYSFDWEIDTDPGSGTNMTSAGNGTYIGDGQCTLSRQFTQLGEFTVRVTVTDTTTGLSETAECTITVQDSRPPQ